MHRIPFRLERIPAISDHDAMIPSFQLSNSFVESECGTAFKPLPHRKPQATSSLRVSRTRCERRPNKSAPEPRPGATVQTRRALGAAPASRPPCYQIPTLRGYDTLRNAFSRASVQRQNLERHESGHATWGGAEGVASGDWVLGDAAAGTWTRIWCSQSRLRAESVSMRVPGVNELERTERKVVPGVNELDLVVSGVNELE